MDALETIYTRRSIRKFTNKKVSNEIILELLSAAMSAPSAGNQRPWQFIVLTDRGLLDAIPTVHPYSAMLKQVSLAILVCGDITLEKYEGFWVQDCSAATQNLLLAAHAKGLGAVWLGIYPVKERVNGIRDLLQMPDHIIPLCLVPIGYAAIEKPRLNERFDPMRIRYNHW